VSPQSEKPTTSTVVGAFSCVSSPIRPVPELTQEVPTDTALSDVCSILCQLVHVPYPSEFPDASASRIYSCPGIDEQTGDIFARRRQLVAVVHETFRPKELALTSINEMRTFNQILARLGLTDSASMPSDEQETTVAPLPPARSSCFAILRPVSTIRRSPSASTSPRGPSNGTYLIFSIA
jgi:hypothetical protein